MMATAISSAVIRLAGAVLLASLAARCSDSKVMPRPHSPDSTRIAVIGDYGSPNGNVEEVAQLVRSWAPDFVVTTGDNCYSAAIDSNIGQYYHQYIHPYSGAFGAGAATNRFFPSLGNHDWDFVISCNDDTCWGGYLDYFTLPGNERYYKVALGPVDLFVIDSDHQEPDGTLTTSAQAAWLHSGLSASTAPWKIVCFHHPPFASGARDSTMAWPFKTWGAAAVLSGHLHVYERIVKEGFPYFVNGVGGRSLHPFGPIYDPDSQVRFNDDFGAMLIVADDQRIRFQFFSVADSLIDTYWIERM